MSEIVSRHAFTWTLKAAEATVMPQTSPKDRTKEYIRVLVRDVLTLHHGSRTEPCDLELTTFIRAKFNRHILLTSKKHVRRRLSRIEAMETSAQLGPTAFDANAPLISLELMQPLDYLYILGCKPHDVASASVSWRLGDGDYRRITPAPAAMRR